MFFLAFDHRGAFSRAVLDLDSPQLTADSRQRVRDAKRVICRAAELVLENDSSAAGWLGILVDEEFGEAPARSALAKGITVVMPVEAADRSIFDFDYGAEWREHVRAFEPDIAKALVRLNVEGNVADNAAQLDRLLELSLWLRPRPTRFMFELVVEATPEQTRLCATTGADFEREVRPALIVRAMDAVQQAGIQPDIWKLDGIDETADAERVVSQARNTPARQNVTCIVMGAGESDARVRRWVEVAAQVDGYTGFAVGRSLWRASIRNYLAGSLTEQHAVAEIAARYLELVGVYRGARIPV